MISRGFASWGTCQEKIYISQGWEWVQVTARQRRSMSTSQKVRITSEKESLYIDRGRHRVKKLKTRLRVLGGICDILKGRKEKAKLNGKKNGSYLSGIWSWLFMLKELVALKNKGKIIDLLMSLLFLKMWPTEHKCITNQFNRYTNSTLEFHMICGWHKCQAHFSVSMAWSPGRGKSPDLTGILNWQGHISRGILTSGSETMETFPTAS